MFNAYVLQIPTYLIMSKLGWVDTYAALIAPAFALPMGLFLMKQFMEQIPDALIEAAKIDGAKEGRIFLSDRYAKRKTGLADSYNLLSTEPLEYERTDLYLL